MGSLLRSMILLRWRGSIWWGRDVILTLYGGFIDTFLMLSSMITGGKLKLDGLYVQIT